MNSILVIHPSCRAYSFLVVITILSVISSWINTTVWAGDWPQYRGPELNGISTENIRTNWSAEPPKLIWKKNIEPGLCSFTISGGKMFTQVRRKIDGVNTEVCIALDPQTCQELWATPPLDISYYPGTGFPDLIDGPRSTPVVSGSRLFVFTSHLKLFCLETSTGTELWHRDFCAELDSPELIFCGGASPVIEYGLVLVNCNHINQSFTAFRPEDGSIAWTTSQYFQLTHATPIPVTLSGVRQVIGVGHKGLFSLSPDDGLILWQWSIPAIQVYSQTVLTMMPVVGSNVVYYSFPYGVGASAVRIENEGGMLVTNGLWRMPARNQNYWTSPIFHEGYLYGTFGYYDLTGNTNGYTGRFGCVELETGEVKWTQPKIVNGGIIMVGGYLVVLTQWGVVKLIKPDPNDYQELGEIQAVTDWCWNSPVFSDGRLYVRSRIEAACYDLAPNPAVNPPLRTELAQTNGMFQLRISNVDGSSLAPERRDRIEVLSSTNLAEGLASWMRLTNLTIFMNGEWGWEEVLSSTHQQRFFQTREQP